MVAHEPAVISSNVLREFVRSGGRIKYVPVLRDENETHWYVYAIDTEGAELQVVIGRSGKPKSFKSAGSLYKWHLDTSGNGRICGDGSWQT